jgi:hypothetical protein
MHRRAVGSIVTDLGRQQSFRHQRLDKCIGRFQRTATERHEAGQASQRKEMLASGAAHKRLSSPQHYLKVQPEAPGF